MRLSFAAVSLLVVAACVDVTGGVAGEAAGGAGCEHCSGGAGSGGAGSGGEGGIAAQVCDRDWPRRLAAPRRFERLQLMLDGPPQYLSFFASFHAEGGEGFLYWAEQRLGPGGVGLGEGTFLKRGKLAGPRGLEPSQIEPLDLAAEARPGSMTVLRFGEAGAFSTSTRLPERDAWWEPLPVFLPFGPDGALADPVELPGVTDSVVCAQGERTCDGVSGLEVVPGGKQILYAQGPVYRQLFVAPVTGESDGVPVLGIRQRLDLCEPEPLEQFEVGPGSVGEVIGVAMGYPQVACGGEVLLYARAVDVDLGGDVIGTRYSLRVAPILGTDPLVVGRSEDVELDPPLDPLIWLESATLSDTCTSLYLSARYWDDAAGVNFLTGTILVGSAP